MRQILIAVLACDYALTSDGRHDGHRLGPRSIARLERALEYANAQSLPIQFVFSAGKLVEADSRLCDLQMGYVAARNFKALVPPKKMQIWGSKPELQFMANTAANFVDVRVVIVSEDYHCWRLRKIAKALGIHSAKVLGTSSLDNPPSFSNLVHEVMGVGELYLPVKLVLKMKDIRHRGLQQNFKS